MGLSSCGKENCEKLVKIACDRLAEKPDGDERCDRLKRQSETVDDEQCGKTLELLKESGKLENRQ